MGSHVIDRDTSTGHDHTHEARQAARGGAVSIAGAATSAVMGFLVVLVLARSFGASGSGVVLLVIAVFSISLAMAKAGMDTAAIWLLPRLVLSDVSKVRAAILVLLIPAAVVGSILAFTLMYVARNFGLFEGAGPEAVLALSNVTWFLPCAAVMMVGLSVTRGLGSVLPHALIGAIAIPMSRPVGILLVAAFGGTVAWAALVWALPLAFGMIAALLVLWLRLRRHERHEGITGHWMPDRGMLTGVWKFALPRWFSAGAEQLIVWFDVILVGVIAGSAAAGVYGSASRFVAAGLIISTAMRMVVSPRFSALLSENKIRAVQELYSTTVMWIVLLGAPIYILLIFFSSTALSWLGDGFESGILPLIVLCCGAIATLLAGNVDSVLTMSGRSGWVAINKTIVLVINVIGNVLLVPIWGIMGAAVSWAGSLLLEAVLASIETRIFVGVRFDVRRVSYAFLVAAVSAGIPSTVAIALFGNNTLACLLAVGGAILLLVLWCLLDRRRLRMSDLALFPRLGKAKQVQPVPSSGTAGGTTAERVSINREVPL